MPTLQEALDYMPCPDHEDCDDKSHSVANYFMHTLHKHGIKAKYTRKNNTVIVSSHEPESGLHHAVTFTRFSDQPSAHHDEMKDDDVAVRSVPDPKAVAARRAQQVKAAHVEAVTRRYSKPALGLADRISNFLESTQYLSDTEISNLIKRYTGKRLKGGKGDMRSPSHFPYRSLKMGMKVEMEHTSDKNTAIEIVTDHLSENPTYYDKLRAYGLADELR